MLASLILPLTPEMYTRTSPIAVGLISADAHRSQKIVKYLERLANVHTDIKVGTLNCSSYAAFCAETFGKEYSPVVLKKKNEFLEYG